MRHVLRGLDFPLLEGEFRLCGGVLPRGVGPVLGQGGWIVGSYIIKHANANAGIKDWTGALSPIAQQADYARRAALAGVVANGFGLVQVTRPEEFSSVALWLLPHSCRRHCSVV
ncbi:MAG: hypothetical protein OXQ29_09575 [Rhodospirillaceae bacterium]|nr:hypothetical protein [Rhodospirillaceae bacterium]